MTLLEEYQREVQRTCGTTGRTETLVMAVIGLAGETGECCDIIKKHLFHGHVLNEKHMMKELGDVLWYLTALCNVLELSLDDVLAANVMKLEKRYPDGFNVERSLNREKE